MKKDVYVQITDQLPQKVKGLTVEMEDGTYIVLINERLQDIVRSGAAIHEFDHIAHEFDRITEDLAGMSADLIEAVAHGRRNVAGSDLFIVNGDELP